MPDASFRGHFLWHELMTSDTRAAAAFYTRALGWGTEKWPQDPSYTLFTNKGVPAAGLMTIPPEAKAMGSPPTWMVYIGTPDVQVTAWEAQRLGGKLHKEPTKTPSVGTWAVVQDPHGAVFACYTPERPMPVPWPPKPGEFSWHELATTDPTEAFDFYRELFGWQKTGSFDTTGIYQMYGFGKKALGGIYRKSPDAPGPPHWLAYTRVPDSKQSAEVIKQVGGKVITGPMEVPGGDWVAVATDPQGAVFAVHSVKAKVKKAAVKKKKARVTKAKATVKKARATAKRAKARKRR